jgi:uncharacterized YccA/Bax inhibitor family protein
MQSKNPILSRRDAFSGAPGTSGAAAGPGTQYYDGQRTGRGATTHPGPGRLSDAQLDEMYGYGAGPAQARMTMDDVVVKTGLCLAVLIAFAAAAWAIVPVENFGPAMAAAVAAMVLGLVISFKRIPNPALILPYAALQGVFVGALSHYFNNTYPGVVIQAVIGTFAVFAAMLAMYQMKIIKVTDRYARTGMAIAMGFVLLIVVNLVFGLFGAGDGLGFRSGGLGILMGVLGVALGAFFLSLDFKQVEDGIAAGAPAKQSWIAAFGLTLSLVWIYTELLRLLAIVNGRD